MQNKSGKKGSRRTRRLGMPWIRRYTHYPKDPAILELIKECGHAAYTWLDFIVLHLAALWEAEGEQGLEYPVEYWLEQVCLLKPGDINDFRKFLTKAHSLGLLIVEHNGDNIKIASPDLIALADEYTRKKQRKQQKSEKKESTKARLERLEKQIEKLTETVTVLLEIIQKGIPVPEVREKTDKEGPPGENRARGPSEEEKRRILSEFEERFKLKTDDWRKAVILLAFPPKENIGPGYLARMNDLSQVVRALEIWREKHRSRVDIERIEKIEEARVFARMVKENMFDIEQVPGELKDFVRQILDKGGNGHVSGHNVRT
ncbi:hypothetical protein Thein_1978 [Thermodesulfatator indicus DSM 15286]|uniref:Lin1244/Lin1753-like N-terminal domain-containing protein n=1 Tax=Thermodesulfatator indicus (strain DSM 15286 / JCM 11887 / CIR29812) TaxID=667014 RepID=F8ACQ3_THEID|nr:hypothetical protein [Thermodesulfatator indicus]AEH45832.1 hypothetical protein Thein_1978 [Thermodesulfatator indicus DSM 15286]